MTELLANIEITPNKPPENYPDAKLKIKEISITPAIGRINLKMAIDAISESNDLAVELVAKGSLFFANPKVTKVGSDKLYFNIVIESLRPSLTWRSFTFSANDFIEEYITVKTIKNLQESLVIPIPVSKVYSHTISTSGEFKSFDEKTKSEIWMNYSGRDISLDLSTGINAFIFSEKGIYLEGSIDSDNYTPPVAPSISEREFNNEIDRLTKLLSDRKDAAEFKHNLTIHIGKSLVDKSLDKFNKLNDDQRSISVVSSNVKGSLFEEKWRDNILGDGGLFVKLDGANAISANVKLLPLALSWSPSEITYQVSATVNATAKIKVHFDPLVGGGIGKRMTLDGSATPIFKGATTISMEKIGDFDAVIIKNTTECQNYPLTVMDRGDLKVGVITSQIIGDQKPTLSPLISSIPQYEDLSRLKKKDSEFTIHFPDKYLEYKSIPKEVSLSSNGIRIAIDLNVAYKQASKIVDVNNLEQKFVNSLKNLQNQQKKPQCPKCVFR